VKEQLENPPEDTRTFAQSVLGPLLHDPAALERLEKSGRMGRRAAVALRAYLGLSPTLRLAGGAALLAALILVPFLGAVGLWDPWETHYGEVARSMVQRGDYVFPYWENAWFFSKPAMTMWLMAVGMNLVGTNAGEGALGLYTEWGMRLPFVALSILAVALSALAVGRVVSRRAGFATAVVMTTMPMYFLLSRQAVTDTPFVTAFVCAMACALIGQLDATTRRRTAWWYAFYVFCGMATLAKGLLGVGFPAVILLLYAALCVMPWDGQSLRRHVDWVLRHALLPAAAGFGIGVGVFTLAYLAIKGIHFTGDPGQMRANRIIAGIIGFCAFLVGFTAALARKGPRSGEMPVMWAQFYKMRLGTGIPVFFAVAAPWYMVMSLFRGVDDESKIFWLRFFIHDHFNRLAAGVHTTTPGGTFTYFIEQGGFGIFPWVALVPGALAVVARLRLRSADPADHVGVIAALWVVFSFTLLGASQTKFHHYVFPVLPGLAILIALFVDKLWKEGIARHAVVLIFGLALLILVGADLASNPKNFTDLFVYNYDRPYPEELVNRPLSLLGGRALWLGDLYAGLLVLLGGGLTLHAFGDRKASAGARGLGLTLLLCGVALVLTVWLRGRGSPSMFLGLALLFGALYFGMEASKEKPQGIGLWSACGALAILGFGLLLTGVRGPDPLLAKLVEVVNVKKAMGHAFGVAAFLLAVTAIMRARTLMFATFLVLALGFAGWFNWSHWVDLSHHWTQRDLFWKYHALRGGPDEPITAYLMNWRGETFYSRNRVKQIKDNGRMTAYSAQPGRKWALVEHNRLGALKTAAGQSRTITVHTTAATNNKFLLVSID
jgi:4-amino-4-deoxy-L-arabinose transferase-like glycosyltransferase